ncbi:cAMP-regulated phosphoprotein 19 isoform X2 [Tursiops truncatus]|uniref:cAMP-regulated phosphoprotein 19 isoform X2 n=1 Tax=Tursiops truncatus TaxID=9739 RepID=UPI000950B95F
MSAEVPEAASAEEQKEMEDKVTSPEKAEEAKLKARYPHLGQKPGGSDFLRKRLQKGAFNNMTCEGYQAAVWPMFFRICGVCEVPRKLRVQF